MEQYINKIIHADCLDILKELPDKCIDLVVTSPPYDNLRTYNGSLEWSFEIFQSIAQELARVLKDGGVIVWVVGDATINGDETGTSFRQALFFKDCGLNLHDTMIFEKNKTSFPASPDSKRYSQIFEYMFIFTKYNIRKDIALLCDKENRWHGYTNWGQNTCYDKNGNIKNKKIYHPYRYTQ